MYRQFRFVLVPLMLVVLAACSQPAAPVQQGEQQGEFLRSQALGAALYQQTDDLVFDQLAYPGSYLADDFAVPAGEGWVIDEVGIVNPAQFYTGSTQSVAVFASDPSDPTVPGVLVARRTFQAAQAVARDSLQVVTLAEPVTLEAGAYWLGIEAYGVYLRSPASGNTAVVGSEGAFSPLTFLDPYDLGFALFGSVVPVAAPTFEGLLAAFDGFVADGTLIGNGPNDQVGPNRLLALRNMLADAASLHGSGLTAAACEELVGAAKRVHDEGELLRSHFATGASAAELRALIADLSQVVCE